MRNKNFSTFHFLTFWIVINSLAIKNTMDSFRLCGPAIIHSHWLPPLHRCLCSACLFFLYLCFQYQLLFTFSSPHCLVGAPGNIRWHNIQHIIPIPNKYSHLLIYPLTQDPTHLHDGIRPRPGKKLHEPHYSNITTRLQPFPPLAYIAPSNPISASFASYSPMTHAAMSPKPLCPQTIRRTISAPSLCMIPSINLPSKPIIITRCNWRKKGMLSRFNGLFFIKSWPRSDFRKPRPAESWRKRTSRAESS